MKFSPSILIVLTASLAGSAVCAERVEFLRDVAPTLLRRCSGCHGPKRAEGGYRLTTFANLLRAGESDEKPVIAGKPEDSELWRRVTSADESVRMPQDDDPLSAKEIAALRAWIAAGAKFDGENENTLLASQLPPRAHAAPPKAYRVPVPVQALAFSPDGKQLAVGGYHEISLWDPNSGKLLRRLFPLPQRIQSIKWAGDGARLIVGGGTPGEYGEVAEIAIDGQEQNKPTPVRVLDTFADLVLDVAVSPKGDRIAACSADRQTRAYAMPAGDRLWRAQVHSDWATAAAFSADGKYVVTASRDQTLKVHTAEDGKLFTTYNGHRRQLGKYTGRFSVFAVAFDPESGDAISVGAGRAARVWRPEKAQQENGTATDMEARFFKAGHTRYIDHGFGEPTFALTAAKGALFLAGADGIVKQFEFKTGKHVRDYGEPRDWIYALSSCPARQLIASGAFDGRVRIWNTNSGELHREFTPAPGWKTTE